jgi:hypothetical protein
MNEMVHGGSEQGRILLFLSSAEAKAIGFKTGSTEYGSESIGS